MVARVPIGEDFFEVQRRQKRKTYILFFFLIGFYVCASLLLVMVALVSLGLFLPGYGLIWNNSAGAFWKLFLFCLLLSGFFALFHFGTALRSGAAFIRERLKAQQPDGADLYHQQVVNMIEEMRLACGIPKVHSFVIPSVAINSMALIESDGCPSIVVTEGLLADCTREEVQAVVAHELAHILRGDALYVSFVCSLVNVFERVREFFEPATVTSGDTHQRDAAGGSLVYVAAWISSTMMMIFGSLVSRQREFMADAAAVELCRNPMALARAIYKANTRYSQVGGTNDVYSPIFIVDPHSHGLQDNSGIFGRLLGTHPPAMKRIERLAAMAAKCAPDVLSDIRAIQRERARSRTVLKPFLRESSTDALRPDSDNKHWLICDAKGQWQGPYQVEQLVFLPFFTTLVRVKNLLDDKMGTASDFETIRELLHRAGTSSTHAGHDECPRCAIPLNTSPYEGTSVKSCSTCGGKYIHAATLDRILVRAEVAFDEYLHQKAQDFRKTVLLNPFKRPLNNTHLKKETLPSQTKIHSSVEPLQTTQQKQSETLLCPTCGAMMLEHPFSYQYFIPVFKCLLCRTFWFDPDNLELLQILVETNREKEF